MKSRGIKHGIVISTFVYRLLSKKISPDRPGTETVDTSRCGDTKVQVPEMKTP
jgi:hypothetical protein